MVFDNGKSILWCRQVPYPGNSRHGQNLLGAVGTKSLCGKSLLPGNRCRTCLQQAGLKARGYPSRKVLPIWDP
ncbi:MAG: hypothetical protein DWQ02_12040 [Bacteroidetes bacterium]|nr:MAG: hypothetical protein DWQ02_12040 [Bacteroidota bacterium]